jgi:hypothetical protein
MKILHITAAAALLTNTMWVTPAFGDTIPTPTADAADTTTLDAMQAQCDALALVHGPATGPNDHWSGEVVEGAVTLVAGPTEVAGTRVIDTSTIVGTGTFTPGTTYIEGAPFRVGGSVNLFGDQYATSGNWSDSTYYFTADFNSTFAHAFSCNIYQEVYHPGYVIPGHGVEGYYVIDDNDHGSDEDAIRANCEAFTAKGPDASQPWWGTDHAFCKFVKTGDATDDETVDPTWDDPALVGNEPGVAVNQDQTDTLTAFEDHGGPVQASGGPFHIGQVVVCISPSTTTKKGVPGAWVAKNGYDGGDMVGPAAGCNTPYFKIAPWGAGTNTSNGTYISVPDYHY